MLQLKKNQLVTAVAQSQADIRQMEIDWYCNNYDTITGQATMLAGFAFSQLTTPMPDDPMPPMALEFSYLFLTCMAIGLELTAIILSTFLSVWAPSLAIRGKNGSADLHKAVDCLRDYQTLVFGCFIVGWILFFISNICQVWIYFRRRVALVVTVPLLFFVLLIVWYTCDITGGLRLSESEVVEGKIEQLKPYELIADLDSGLSNSRKPRAPAGAGLDMAAADQGFCPVHEVETFQPRLYSERAARGASSTGRF